MLVYLGLGVLWTWWLEYYTTKYLDGRLGEPWNFKERVIQIITWPFGLLVFLYTFFKGM
jgi:hypothetical protein